MSKTLDSERVEPGAADGRWQRVLRDSEWQKPLSELAGSYYYCVYAWWRRAGLEAPKAGTATVASFNRWLTDSRPTPDQPGAARLREWLPAQLTELATKGVKLTAPPALKIDAAWCERRFAAEPPGDPETVFARRWALTMLEFSVLTLREEYAARGEETLFPELLAFAGVEEKGNDGYAEAATRIGRSAGALRAAVNEFRQRQRELLLSLARDTLLDPSKAESEMGAFLRAFGGPAQNAAPGAMPTVIRWVKPEEMLTRAMQAVKLSGPGAAQTLGAPTVEEAARLFPQYEILALLGRGGLDAVYKARQPSLDRVVAIKLLPLEVSADADFAQRFQRESRVMARLQHQNIIAVYDSGTTSEGHLFSVMEYFKGANLQAVVHGPRLLPERALEIAAELCEAMGYAHGQGVIHRDLKPANVVVSPEGQVKVANFGLARLAEGPAAAQSGWTWSGKVVGTADYLAPEQRRGKQADHRADIYSLGVMLYEMLCREVPRGVFKPPSARVKVDARIDRVIVKALQPEPERRYQSAQAMKSDVIACREGQPAPLPAEEKLLPAEPVASPKAPAGQSGSPRPFASETALLVGVGGAILALAIAGFLYFGRPPAETAGSAAPAKTAAPEAGKTALSERGTPLAATPAHPFVNTLGMKFVPVPILAGPTGGQHVLFNVWDTRVQDYAEFVAETKREWPKPPFEQRPSDPAVDVSWADAQLFGQWLTAREQAAGRLPADWHYRLPSDHEWSCAVDLGAREAAEKLPSEKNGKIGDAHPWGTQWPIPARAGNYASEELKSLQAEGKFSDVSAILEGYYDAYANTSPVGTYPPNRFGLHDMGGNVWQWCDDWFERDQKTRVLRGASWRSGDRRTLLASARDHEDPEQRNADCGFRLVVASTAADLAAAQKRKPAPQAPSGKIAAAETETPSANPEPPKPKPSKPKPASSPIAEVKPAPPAEMAAAPSPSPSKAPAKVAAASPKATPAAVAQAAVPEEPTLAPELAPLAGKHTADLAAAETQGKNAIARAQRDYLATLTSADKTASVTGDVKSASAIAKEIDQVKNKPEMASLYVNEMPEPLRPPRKTFVDAIASALRESKKREQQIDGEYLRGLTALEARANASSDLKDQLDSEKRELLRKTSDKEADAAAPVATLSPGEAAVESMSEHGERLRNGTFAQVDGKGFPVGWELAGAKDEDAVIPNGVIIKTMKEENNSFVRMSFEGPYHEYGFKQTMEIPEHSRNLAVKIRYRGKVTGRLDTAAHYMPSFSIGFLDESGHGISSPGWNSKIKDLEASFVTFEKTIPIPKGAVKANFNFGNGNCNGVFDFAHASASFR